MAVAFTLTSTCSASVSALAERLVCEDLITRRTARVRAQQEVSEARREDCVEKFRSGPEKGPHAI